MKLTKTARLVMGIPQLDPSGTIPTQSGIPTCLASRAKLAHKKHDYRDQIYNYIRGHNGATCDEVEVGLFLRHQTASCFIRFLTQDGFLYASPDRRTTRAGRSAIVWRTKNPNDQQVPLL